MRGLGRNWEETGPRLGRSNPGSALGRGASPGSANPDPTPGSISGCVPPTARTPRRHPAGLAHVCAQTASSRSRQRGHPAPTLTATITRGSTRGRTQLQELPES